MTKFEEPVCDLQKVIRIHEKAKNNTHVIRKQKVIANCTSCINRNYRRSILSILKIWAGKGSELEICNANCYEDIFY